MHPPPAAWLYAIAADAVLVLHFAIVLFVVGGLVLVLAGNAAGWRWVNDLGFRLAHLAAIAIVVAESWLGVTCPLTSWESWLRVQAGSAGYGGGGFVETWVTRLLFYDAPPAVFTAAYTLFALAVVVVWWRYPPRRRR